MCPYQSVYVGFLIISMQSVCWKMTGGLWCSELITCGFSWATCYRGASDLSHTHTHTHTHTHLLPVLYCTTYSCICIHTLTDTHKHTRVKGVWCGINSWQLLSFMSHLKSDRWFWCCYLFLFYALDGFFFWLGFINKINLKWYLVVLIAPFGVSVETPTQHVTDKYK